MTSDQLSRLRKLMQLSLSANDNEALSALRKANAILVENKMNWEDVFKMIDNSGVSEALAAFQQRNADLFKSVFGVSVQTWGNVSNVRNVHFYQQQ